jgi:hypothetical protein
VVRETYENKKCKKNKKKTLIRITYNTTTNNNSFVVSIRRTHIISSSWKGVLFGVQ